MAWKHVLLWYVYLGIPAVHWLTVMVSGYLAWEYPTNRLLQRLPLGKYSAACILVWGLILSCFAGVKSFSGAVAIRFFLGVFEAAVTPGFALLTSQVRMDCDLQPRTVTDDSRSGTPRKNRAAGSTSGSVSTASDRSSAVLSHTALPLARGNTAPPLSRGRLSSS